jgi:hypothetical protein
MSKLTALALLCQILDCHPEYPGYTGDLWSWRMIEGRKCWYAGPRKLPKERLRWAKPREEEPPTWIVNPPPPAAPVDEEFELRWRGLSPEK